MKLIVLAALAAAAVGCSSAGSSGYSPAYAGGAAGLAGASGFAGDTGSGGTGAGGSTSSGGSTSDGSGGSTSSGGSGPGGSGGTSASGGSGGTSASGGSGGSSGGPTCAETGPEPNNTTATASSACGANAGSCELTDCDSDGTTGFGGSLQPIKDVIDPADPVDYFTYHGTDTFGCVVDPTATTQDSGLVLCEFVHCDQGTTNFKSCTAGTDVKSTAEAPDSNGDPGCCVTGPGTVTLDYACSSGLDDSAQVYIRADQPSICSEYSVDYHF